MNHTRRTKPSPGEATARASSGVRGRQPLRARVGRHVTHGRVNTNWVEAGSRRQSFICTATHCSRRGNSPPPTDNTKRLGCFSNGYIQSDVMLRSVWLCHLTAGQVSFVFVCFLFAREKRSHKSECQPGSGRPCGGAAERVHSIRLIAQRTTSGKPNVFDNVSLLGYNWIHAVVVCKYICSRLFKLPSLYRDRDRWMSMRLRWAI